jgi:hypothetical protein
MATNSQRWRAISERALFFAIDAQSQKDPLPSGGQCFRLRPEAFGGRVRTARHCEAMPSIADASPIVRSSA